MKEFRIKVYPFGELSEEVQKKLIEKNRWDLGDAAMECNSSEREDTLRKFEEVFGISVHYEVDYCGSSFRVYFDDAIYENDWDSEVEWYFDEKNVKGKLLLRYLNSKFCDLYERKNFWGKFKYDEDGKCYAKKRASKILWISECPLTGVCYDEDILGPIRDFLRKPDMNLTLKELIDQCVGKFMDSWNSEWEYCCDNEEFLTEEMENRHEDDLYFADGTLFVGNVSELEELAA